MFNKINLSIYQSVIDLENHCDTNNIFESLNKYVIDILSSKINILDIGEWRILIIINYRSTTDIGVYKRVRRYPSDLEFEISISIPIPDNDDASYGIPEENQVSPTPLNLGFSKGFTCNGKKIKFQK